MPEKLKPELNKNLDESVRAISQLSSVSDVASYFEIPEGQLLYILYKLPDNKKYRFFEIKKRRGGHRLIKAPIGGTAILLKKLKPALHQLYKTKSCVHGFVNGKSIVSNAKQHKKKRYVLNVDLANFYDNINFGRIRGLFMSKPFNMAPNAATLMAQLCTHDNSLPQGSPVSPVLSNFIASNLDKRLTLLAKKYGLQYSRYADDITFSTSKKDFPKSFGYYEGNNPITGNMVIGKLLEDQILASGFVINYDKVRLQYHGVRQEVTGLTVNEFPNVERSFVRKIRAMIHAWKKFGLIEAEKTYISCYAKPTLDISSDNLNGAYYKSVVYGRLAFLKMVRDEEDEVYMKLCLKVAEIDSNAPRKILETKEMFNKFDIFISHASEDKDDVALPIYEACKKIGVNAFLDVKYIRWGDSLTEKINHALGQSKFVLAILSENSVGKTWPSKEINAALAREIEGKQKILPLIVGSPDLSSVSLLVDKLHFPWEKDASKVAHRIKELTYEKYQISNCK
ncbi:TIR domain-containing protein [Nitrosomonas aestuarii]|uniref:RNA-directed DNA polymerase n=1 Tax=Nitrosomonas aestuarii TaxID=52441 RepID=A0A1I4BL96_9PROT|nr:TIR domain-containing anti-phage reverse transcriptase [Nitrosomonas aestuarii]SFK69604.1 TIR domain-containing protein [Nitrosomonas aestuarii]